MKYSDYVSISADYGKLLVTNLMVINAGALLIFPSLLQELKREHVNLQSASTAAFVFVVGLVLAGLSGYAAYLNFMWLAQSAAHRENADQFKSDCTPEMLALDANRATVAQIEKSIRKNDIWATTCLIVGNAFGIASGVAFCIGCYYAQQSIRF